MEQERRLQMKESVCRQVSCGSLQQQLQQYLFCDASAMG